MELVLKMRFCHVGKSIRKHPEAKQTRWNICEKHEFAMSAKHPKAKQHDGTRAKNANLPCPQALLCKFIGKIRGFSHVRPKNTEKYSVFMTRSENHRTVKNAQFWHLQQFCVEQVLSEFFGKLRVF